MGRATDFLIRATRAGRAPRLTLGRLPDLPEGPRIPASPGVRVAGCPPGVVHLAGSAAGPVLHVPYPVGGPVRLREDATPSGDARITLVHTLDEHRTAMLTLHLQPVADAAERRGQLLRSHDPDPTTCVVLDAVPYPLGRADRALILRRSDAHDPRAPAAMITLLRLGANELVVNLDVDDADQIFDHLAAVDALLDAIAPCPRAGRTCPHVVAPGTR